MRSYVERWDGFELTKHQGEFWMQVAEVSLENEEPKWEPVSVMYAGAPVYLETKLKRARLRQATKQSLKYKYGVRL